MHYYLIESHAAGQTRRATRRVALAFKPPSLPSLLHLARIRGKIRGRASADAKRQLARATRTTVISRPVVTFIIKRG